MKIWATGPSKFTFIDINEAKKERKKNNQCTYNKYSFNHSLVTSMIKLTILLFLAQLNIINALR